ncbi:MAG: ATP-binding protein [Rhodobacteraceae bacterium]|nr:ATP-binding protein [Paracoccaceae bacterium]
MTAWRFYGRESELAKLIDELDYRMFHSATISGRRGIGKSSLLLEAAALRPATTPLVMCELPSPEEGATEACRVLSVAVEQAGLGRLLGSLRPRSPNHSDRMWFSAIVRHLLENGAVVALDEFHHARGLFLESSIKVVIDRLKFTRAKRPELGKLFVMGSHQQQLFRMPLYDQPLWGRFGAAARLGQWKLSTVMEMAREHGFLAHPGRFMTLWTAFGGLPSQWEGFAVDRDAEALRDFAAWLDDDDWRLAFLDRQRARIVEVAGERYDDGAFVELAPATRDLLLWLGRHAPRGAREHELPAALRKRADPPLEESCGTLVRHLELLAGRVEFLGDSRFCNWTVTDCLAKFQIHVFGVGMRRVKRRAVPGMGLRRRNGELDRLKTLEECSLERMAAAFYAELPWVSESECNVWRRQDPGGAARTGNQVEIDVLARPHPERGGGPVVFGECKRNPEQHRRGQLEQAIDRFMEALENLERRRLFHQEDPPELRDLRRRRRSKVLISPEFTAAQRRRLEGGGFSCLDIPEIARQLEQVSKDARTLRLLQPIPSRDADRRPTCGFAGIDGPFRWQSAAMSCMRCPQPVAAMSTQGLSRDAFRCRRVSRARESLVD